MIKQIYSLVNYNERSHRWMPGADRRSGSMQAAACPPTCSLDVVDRIFAGPSAEA